MTIAAGRPGTAGPAVTAAVRAISEVVDRATLALGGADGPEWTSLREFVVPEHFSAAVEAVGDFYGGAGTPVTRAAAGSLLFSDVVGALAVPIAAGVVAHRRALLLDPAHVRLRLGTLSVDAVAADRVRVAVLASDPLAGAPDTVVVPGQDGLRAAAATGYAALVDPLVRAAAATLRRGRRALWTEAGERLAAAALLAVRGTGRLGEAPSEVDPLLDAAPEPLRGQVRWVRVPVGRHPQGEAGDVDAGAAESAGPCGDCLTGGGCPAVGSVPWKRRTVCCLAYKTPRFSGELCATCPRVPVEETVARMADWLREQTAS